MPRSKSQANTPRICFRLSSFTVEHVGQRAGRERISPRRGSHGTARNAAEGGKKRAGPDAYGRLHQLSLMRGSRAALHASRHAWGLALRAAGVRNLQRNLKRTWYFHGRPGRSTRHSSNCTRLFMSCEFVARSPSNITCPPLYSSPSHFAVFKSRCGSALASINHRATTLRFTVQFCHYDFSVPMLSALTSNLLLALIT